MLNFLGNYSKCTILGKELCEIWTVTAMLQNFSNLLQSLSLIFVYKYFPSYQAHRRTCLNFGMINNMHQLYVLKYVHATEIEIE